MVKRRTLGEGLSPEEEAFLNPGESDQKAKTIPQSVPAAVSEPAAPTVAAPSDVEPVATPPVSTTSYVPLAAMAGRMPLNTRLPTELSTALLTAAMQRKIQRHPIFTQQDIVAEAVADWLRKHGYASGKS